MSYNPDQPRDERGRWGEGSSSVAADHQRRIATQDAKMPAAIRNVMSPPIKKIASGQSRVSIRESVYRDKKGWTVSPGRGYHVFTTHSRANAEYLREKIRRGEDINTVDFTRTK